MNDFHKVQELRLLSSVIPFAAFLQRLVASGLKKTIKGYMFYIGRLQEKKVLRKMYNFYHPVSQTLLVWEHGVYHGNI